MAVAIAPDCSTDWGAASYLPLRVCGPCRTTVITTLWSLVTTVYRSVEMPLA